MKRVFAMCFVLCCTLLGAAEQDAFLPTQWVGTRLPAANIKVTQDGISVEKADMIQTPLNQLIKVDPKAVYVVSGEFKSLKKDPKQLLFFGLGCMDQKMTHIGSCEVLVFPGTETTVVKDTPRGSTTILVKDASQWPKRNQAHILGFNVKANYADLPNRNFSGNIMKVEKVPEGYQLTLRYGLPRAVKANTPVRLHSHGPGRNFCAAHYAKVNWEGWKTFSGKISTIVPHGAPLNKFWRSTAYARVVISLPAGVIARNIKVVKLNGKVDVVSPKVAAAVKAKAPVKKAANPISIARVQGEKLFPRYYNEIIKSATGKRPRVLFTSVNFEDMKKKMEKNVHLKNMFNELKRRVDLYPDTVNDESVKKKYGGSVIFYGNDKGGPCSVRAAFIYRLTGDKKYALKGIKYLRYAADYYNRQYAAHKAVGWTSHSRISAMCAYDWLYDVMTPAERKEIGMELIKHIRQAQNTTWIVRSGLQNKGEGTSAWSSSFYGTPHMKLYAGITFAKTGLDDALAEKWLKEGLLDHLRMLSYRSLMSGEFGGGNNSTPGYVFGGALLADRYFYIQFKSLTGRNVAEDFPNNGMLPHWLAYATFQGIDGNLYEHGTGGSWHLNNRADLNIPYLALYRSFFPNSKSVELVDNMISTQKKFRNPAEVYASGQWRFSGYVPWYPFLYNYTDPKNYKPDPALFKSMPKAFFFSKLGQTYMVSSRTKDGTYAMFTCGARSAAHKQYDENHFVIYKGGFLALDSGTRSASGMKDWLDDMWHDSNYSAASIAHNVITIRMEGEKWAGWPKKEFGIANHGGQYKSTGGVVYAFETSDDFTYVAGDATACYRPQKCEKMLRQFVMIYPDYFVIHDVVRSVKPDQKKTFLLHSQNEPEEKGDIFSFDEEQGRLFCRTFLPHDFVRTKIGGPGKEFWIENRNYHLGKTRIAEYKKRYGEEGFKKLKWGNWRVELSAKGDRKDNEFLNLIQVGLKKDTSQMVPSKMVTSKGMTGVEFTAKDGTLWTVLFTKDGKGGHIKAVRKGKVIVDKPLTNKIQKQKPFSK